HLAPPRNRLGAFARQQPLALHLEGSDVELLLTAARVEAVDLGLERLLVQQVGLQPRLGLAVPPQQTPVAPREAVEAFDGAHERRQVVRLEENPKVSESPEALQEAGSSEQRLARLARGRRGRGALPREPP